MFCETCGSTAMAVGGYSSALNLNALETTIVVMFELAVNVLRRSSGCACRCGRCALSALALSSVGTVDCDDVLNVKAVASKLSGDNVCSFHSVASRTGPLCSIMAILDNSAVVLSGDVMLVGTCIGATSND